MRKINMDKVSSLPTFNQILEEKYGKPGTESRKKFQDEAILWISEALKEGRNHSGRK